MDKLLISKNYLKSFKCDLNFGSESTRFYKDDVMIKLLNKDCLLDDRQEIIEIIHEFDYPDIIIPEKEAYEKRTFEGYSMHYLEDYKKFIEFINSITTFCQRKDALFILANIFDYFDLVNFAYHDIHAHNILYKDNDLKLIDLDGGIARGYINKNIDFDTSKRAEKKSLARFILCVLYQVKEPELLELSHNIRKKDYKRLFDILPKNLHKLFEFALNDEYYIYYGITESLYNFTEDAYEETKGLIKKKRL